ncbi:MAG: hypothetical protein H6853_04455 [Rhodospirillales bacterium]|nr:hypothetical protein [Alphaproteobacteria bacterium]USO04521.1 MAG: hypothetical protein H6853_04455 [Rhodospirillales bacterium]
MLAFIQGSESRHIMNEMLFYMGQGPDSQEAVREALSRCAPVLEQNSSLLVELLELNPCGSHWEAHIRVMAMEGAVDKHPHHAPDDLKLRPKSPEHFRSGHPYDWRPVGMKHDMTPAKGFDVAAHGGYIPDVPLQDIELGKAGWSEVAIRTHAASNDRHHTVNLAHEPALRYENE